jgi:hypothetical protein
LRGRDRSSSAGQVKHTDFAMASGELTRSDFVGFLKRLAQAAAVSRDGAVHYVCMDWRHVGELIEAGGMIYGEMLNLAVWVKLAWWRGPMTRSAGNGLPSPAPPSVWADAAANRLPAPPSRAAGTLRTATTD